MTNPVSKDESPQAQSSDTPMPSPELQPASEAKSAPETLIGRIWPPVRQHLGVASLLMVFMVIAIFTGPRLLLGPEVVLASVVQRDFVQSVVASGRVETPHRVNIGVQITGTVADVPVIEGQVVTMASPLIRLESAELAAAVVQATRAIAHANAELRH